MKKFKVLYIIMALIIIIGSIVYKIKGFNKELLYSNRDQILVSSSKEFDLNRIEEISKEIIGDRKVKVQEYERFGNAVEIITTSISEEEKENIINKINEEYGVQISKDNIKIINVQNTRIKDILKPYILPIIITWCIVLLYFIFIYNKLGLIKILIKGIVLPLGTIATFNSVIAIARIPFGRVTNAISLGIYIASIFILSIYFQKEKQIYLSKKENDG